MVHGQVIRTAEMLDLVGVVPLIVGIDHPPGLHVQGGDFGGGRPYVNTNLKNGSLFAHVSLEFFHARPKRSGGTDRIWTARQGALPCSCFMYA